MPDVTESQFGTEVENETDEVEDTTVTFRSSDPNLRLVRKPEKRRYNEQGDLEILEGFRVEFINGELTVTDPGVVEWLRGHPKCNINFFELGNEPGRISPTEVEAITAIAEAAAEGNSLKLSELYDAEKQTHDRPEVLAAAEKALDKMEAAAIEEKGLPPAEEGATLDGDPEVEADESD